MGLLSALPFSQLAQGYGPGWGDYQRRQQQQRPLQMPVSTAPMGNTNPGMGGYRGMRSSLGLNGLSMLGVPVR